MQIKPQVHRRRNIEAPFKLCFIGCRTTLPHREGILLKNVTNVKRPLGFVSDEWLVSTWHVLQLAKYKCD